MRENKQEHLKELLESFDTAMLLTRHAEKEHARPMAIAAVEGESTLWFVTADTSAKTAEIRKDPRVAATLQSSRRFVALSGHAELVDDRAKLNELWKPGWKVWFPNGKEDPNIRLIRVTVNDVEYWDNAGTKGIRYVFEAARALLRHTTPTITAPLHGRIQSDESIPRH